MIFVLKNKRFNRTKRLALVIHILSKLCGLEIAHKFCATSYLPPNSTVLSRFIGVNMPHVAQIPMQICQMPMEGYILTYWLTSTLHMFFFFVSSRGLYV